MFPASKVSSRVAVRGPSAEGRERAPVRGGVRRAHPSRAARRPRPG